MQEGTLSPEFSEHPEPFLVQVAMHVFFQAIAH
jgi:hypothetical protein